MSGDDFVDLFFFVINQIQLNLTTKFCDCDIMSCKKINDVEWIFVGINWLNGYGYILK